MALVQCPECGRDRISSRATACPACGCPLQAANPTQDSGRDALQSPHLWGRIALVVGAWLVTPWIARLIVALAVCVLAYFIFVRP